MPRSLTRILLAVAACALTAAATPALAPADDATASTPAAAQPCIDIAGIVQVTCPTVTVTPPTGPTAPTKKPAKKKKPACANETVAPAAANLATVNKTILCLVNKERTRRHLVALKTRTVLNGTAERFATELVKDQFFDHTSPDGTTMLDRIESSGYLAGSLHQWWVGENIAYGTGDLATPKAIVRAWMNSPGHRANILQSRFREIGLGVSLGSPDGPAGATYVNDFGRRVR